MRAINITGERFGMLVAVELAERRNNQRRWLCRCDCGEYSVVYQGHLSKGATKSCGCQEGIGSGRKFSHGDTESMEYSSWQAMRNRCLNRNYHRYKDYGGRGITICERWDDYTSFLTDMGRRPGPEYSIERLDNDGNYEPDNCCWATAKEQAANKRPCNRRASPECENTQEECSINQSKYQTQSK